VAKSPPTVITGEQTDLARFRSFLQINGGSGCGSHGSGDRLSPEFKVDVYQVGRLLICGFGKTVCEVFRLGLNLLSDV